MALHKDSYIPRRWHKIIAPKKWNPRPGDKLIGRFVGVVEQSGQFGPYLSFYVETTEGVYYTSGARLTQLVQASAKLLVKGEWVRIDYLGRASGDETDEQSAREFDLYVEADSALADPE